MYERAADAPPLAMPSLGPLWHLAEGRTFFAGPLAYNSSHQHGAPVYLAGLYGDFRLRIQGGAWTHCRTAIIPAGVAHELDLRGDPLGVLYSEPDGAGLAGLIPLLRGARERDGALVADAGEVTPLRDLYEDRAGARTAGPALSDLLRFSRGRAAREIDGRVSRVVALLNESPDALVSAEALARAVGLSASRLQHLFTGEVGAPLRRYRAWVRMRRAIAAIVAGESFTSAAHAAGFCDQPHFANDFRKTFGAPASRSLLNVRR